MTCILLKMISVLSVLVASLCIQVHLQHTASYLVLTDQFLPTVLCGKNIFRTLLTRRPGYVGYHVSVLHDDDIVTGSTNFVLLLFILIFDGMETSKRTRGM